MNLNCYETDWEKERVEQILNNFERCMDSLVGSLNNNATLDIAQGFVNTHVEQMKSIGWRMKDRYAIPRVRVSDGKLHCYPIVFEKEDFPEITVVGKVS